jgi:phospho-N-acetylmuramoyl-pentapeptide-transferase
MMAPLAAFIGAFVLGLALSRALRRSLSWLISRERKAGKEKIHRLFPKRKRPLGGGLAIMIAATAGTVALPLLTRAVVGRGVWWTLGLAWVYALIGLDDDLRKTRGVGMRGRPKLALQMLIGLAFGALMWRVAGFDSVLLPFAGTVHLGAGYIVFAALVVAVVTNAVNLADGIDGLAGGAAVLTLFGFALVGAAFPVEHSVPALVWPLSGAILGFLAHNLPPARILMGDTGALGIGAAIAGLALFSRTELWLPLLAAPFVVDVLSVIIQMSTVRGLWRVVKPLRHRTTETARPFLCTPLHHHFQWLGWTDWRVLALFWGMGALMAAWTGAAIRSDAAWVLGLLALGLFLLGAAAQKRLGANYFLGLTAAADQPRTLGLYRGLPLQVLGIPLYGLAYETAITEGMLVGATAESMLWRPLSEVEAHIVLGRIYADHRLLDQALQEWEQVPTRNLLLRPSVVLRLARLYYGRDRLLEAIKLWEQLPGARLADMPNVREVVRNARLRLADLAGKSYRQSMRMMRVAVESGEAPEQLEAHLVTSRRFNQDLLSLLLYERDKLRGRQPNPEAARTRRELLRQTRNAVMVRLRDLDAALAHLARLAPNLPAPPEAAEGEDAAERAAQELHLSREGLLRLLSPAGGGWPEVTRVVLHPKDSRNVVCRLGLSWPNGGPASVVVKRFAADRVSFFSASYRRERGVLRLLHDYGAAVPRVYAGEMRRDQALLVLQDLGDETLAERLEASDLRTRRLLMQTALKAVAGLQAATHEHVPELTAEIRKVDKERLGQGYYLRAMRIALDRIAGLSGRKLPDSEWSRLAPEASQVARFLSSLPTGFIHFELTPHHLLVAEGGLFIFDLEQATIGPVEFDLAALLAQPESDPGPDQRRALLEYYAEQAAEAGVPPGERFLQGVAYAVLFKCLVYGGAAVHFLDRFGGEHHVQRFLYYLDQCETVLGEWDGLRSLAMLLSPHLHRARQAVAPERFAAPAQEG